MASEEQFNEQESFQLIQQMIGIAKQEQKDDGKGWILWGWLLFAASVLTLINLNTHWFSTFFFWNAFGVITICFFAYSIGKYFLFKPEKKVRTYTSDLLQKLNIGFFISMLFIIIAINIGTLNPVAGFVFLINLYGFRILIQGAALNFKPFITGAFISWVLGFTGLFVKTFDWVMLIHAAAVLSGYIIPGHIANTEFNKARHVNLNIG